MEILNVFEAIYQYITQITWYDALEIIAALCGIVSVWFAKKENILVFPIGIISTAIYVYILFVGKLYAVSGINFYYTIVNVYGWYMWSRVDSKNEKLKITFNSLKSNLIYILLTGVLFAALYFILSRFAYNDETQPYVIVLDSLTSAVFCVAMILEAHKKLESWVYWIIGNAISIPFYFSEKLFFTSVQYIVFLMIAIAAYFAWRKEAIKNA